MTGSFGCSLTLGVWFLQQEILNQITGNLKDAAQPAAQPGAGNLDSSIGANLQLLAQQVNKTYPPPDPSKFTLDKASGYYYDFSTGFYFDARTQYYYNPLTQQFMFWDPMTFTYIPVAAAAPAAATDATVTVAKAVEPAEAPAPAAVVSSEPAATPVVNKQPVKTAAQIAKVSILAVKILTLSPSAGTVRYGYSSVVARARTRP